jgi:hypothetical protein
MPNYRSTFTIFDSDGHESTRTWYLSAANYTAAVTATEDMLQALTPLLAGGFRAEYEVAEKFLLVDPLTYKMAADVGSEVEHLAVYSLNRAGGGKSTLTIPGFDKDTYTVPGGAIDRTDVDVVAFETELIDFGWQDYRAGDYIGVISAEEGFG